MNEYDINIEIGAPWVLYIQVKTAASEPLDLTNYTGKCQIRKTYGGDLICSPSVSIRDPANGICVLSLAALQTASIGADMNGVYDFELTGPGPGFEVARIIWGKAYFKSNVVGPEYPTTIDQGATWKLIFTVKEPNETLKDLTGYTFLSKIKTHRNAISSLMTPSVTVDLPNSQVTLTLTDLETGALPAKTLFHELFMTNTTESLKLFEGDVTVTPQVTS